MSIRPSDQVLAAPNLRRVLVLKNVALVGQTLAMMVVAYGLGMPLPLTVIVLTLLAINVLTWLRLRIQWPVTEAEVFAQLLLDVMILSVLLYLAGGATNPFVLLLLLPLTIAAATLSARYTWSMAAVVVACFGMLMFIHMPLPHFHITYDGEITLKSAGMVLGFALGVGLIVAFVIRMGNVLRERERLLAEAREALLRDRHIVSLGTLAVGAAHEIGTPLATMAVLARELQHEYQDQPELCDKLHILREQVERCKVTLTDMLSSSGRERAESGCRVALDDYLRDVTLQWRRARPGVEFSFNWEGRRPGPDIVAQQTLSQAIINLLNNAADAGNEGLEVVARCDERVLQLSVYDRGQGVSAKVQGDTGRPMFSTKPEGHGLGLFLTRAVVSRLGGALRLFNRPEGGACAELILPLDKLLAGAAP
jgi:two-component system sensor histidine kinase RegB